MAYFLPSFFQKRILRYALSRLELLDTDALELDSLDISWGKRSTVELRDVGLRVKKLSSMLQLPADLRLLQARIVLLKITVPADIYASAILVEVEGVKVGLSVYTREQQQTEDAKRGSKRGGLAKGTKANRPRHTRPLVHDPGGVLRAQRPEVEIKHDEETGRGAKFLPTTVDLAQSFLQTEPPEERAELKAAIAQSQYLQQSQTFSEDGEGHLGMGVDDAPSLPGFLAAFLKGVGDRLEIRINDVEVNVDLEVPSEASFNSNGSERSEDVTMRLLIENIEVEGVTTAVSDSETAAARTNHPDTLKAKTSSFVEHRRITLRGLHGMLISDDSLFTSLSRLSGPSSPATTHISHGETSTGNKVPSGQSYQSDSSSSSAGLGMAQSTVLKIYEPASEQDRGLDASVVTSDGERFADAGREETQEGMETPLPATSVGANQDKGTNCFGYASYYDRTSSMTNNEAPEGSAIMPLESAHSEHSTGRSVVNEPSARHLAPMLARFEMPQNTTQMDFESTTLAQNEIPSNDISQLNPDRETGSSIYGLHLSENGDEQFPEEGEEYNSSTLQESHEMFYSEHPSTVASPAAEDLTQSRMFSHEEAQSMYMSAISQAASGDSTDVAVPGCWDAPTSSSDTSSNSPPGARRRISGLSKSTLTQNRSADSLKDNKRTVISGPQSRVPSHASQLLSESKVPLSTSPKQSYASQEDSVPQGTQNPSTASRNLLPVIKDMLYVDWIALVLPQGNNTPVSQQQTSAGDPNNKTKDSTYQGIPGAFSGNGKLPPSPSPNSESNLPGAQAFSNRSSFQQSEGAMHIESGRISILSDIGLTRLMLMILQQLRASIPTTETGAVKIGSPPENPRDLVTMKATRVSWQLLEVLEGTPSISRPTSAAGLGRPAPPADSEVLLQAVAEGIDFVHRRDGISSSGNLSIGKFTFGYPGDDIVSFNSALKMRESTRDILAPVGRDMILSFAQTSGASKFELMTLPTHISLDLRRLDETFSWFGGFSGMLGLGSSMVSTVTIGDRNSKSTLSTTRVRGVHFETPGDGKSLTGSMHHAQRKITMRIGGFVLDLHGKDCMIRLETTAIKLVSRLQGVGVTVDRLKLSGPHLRPPDGSSSMVAQLVGVRIKYLSTPEENDLDRLLELLSPSKEKYEQDDDILLDMLIRQRRQGGVLRMTAEGFKGSVSNLDELDYFPALTEELSKLSTVTKYLPQDDRPGLLTLGMINNFELKVSVSKDFGDLDLICKDIELAHITFPALAALGIQHVQGLRNNIEELLAEALSVELRDKKEDLITGPNADKRASPKHAPMIMARMVGDEMEPIIKIKLWNVRVEYRVSMIMAMMGLTDDINTSTFVADMASSIATLTSRHQRLQSNPKLSNPAPSANSRSSIPSKPLKLDIGIRDSIIALNPRNSRSRCLVVLTDTRLSGVLPKDDEASAKLDIRKASLMVVDDVKNITRMDGSSKVKFIDGRSNQIDGLSNIGYVSLGYVSAASIILNVVKVGENGERSMDVEVRDQLFVFESCADSTHTLLSVLNGLQPPVPPSKEAKYRTEVMPVEDMLASLSGDAFAATGPSNTSDQYPLGFEEGDMMDDDVPQNLEFVSSFYNPDLQPTAEQIADSMLGDDLGSLASPPITREIGAKVLLQSFQEQYEVAPGSEPLNFRADHFGEESTVGGTAHKWDTKHNTYGLTNELKVRGSPLRVRVRDVHFIWNLFDGYDWQHTRDTIASAVADLEGKAVERTARKERRTSSEMEEEEESVIGDFLFNSIYIGIPANRDPRELARQVNRNLDDLASETESYVTTTTTSGSPSRHSRGPRGKRKRLRLKRSKHHKMTFELKGVAGDLVVFSPGSGETQSSIDVRIQDLEIFDHVPTSTWKKFATYMHDAGERESSTSMIHLEMLNVKPIPDLAASEIILKATILPLRLHVDQDALDFMTRFFEFKDDSKTVHTAQAAEATFLQRVEVNAIRVRLDFKPKRVDYAGLRSGHTTEFMNFFILDQADMVLRHVIIYGVSGFDKLGKTLNDLWMPDVKRNQLPGILAGLAPIRSLVNVGGGVRDLVVVPLKEYRKDGRVVRSIQKGAVAFAKTTTTELVKLGAKLAVGTQTVLQGAEDFLSQQPQQQQQPQPQRSDVAAGWEDAELDDEEKKQISLYADQPVGVMQGLKGAYASLERDLLTARDAIVAMPGEVMESGSAGGAARAVLRGAPTIILRPAMGVSKAVGQTLLGATNSLDPENRRRMEDKYKRH
ncbi:MAG: hypothetical protein FRX48_01087 [Lasallia pustulata]|uniref:Autophagy-related protein 2 n=1 Tax=Lasallia pustulata TaxID=136370 RepID=A0A5M8Q4P8_9LECA|nr:MAG: hypothetical protein FRX48_01087 [Lasallia pustulata]